MNEELVMKMRTTKSKVERDSKEIERMVDTVSSCFENELDAIIQKIKELLSNSDKISDDELELMTLKVPVYMYFAQQGVENIGIMYDASKLNKQQTFNELFDRAEGTISDKKAIAELSSMPQHYVEIVFSRAYKRLKSKIDVCEHLCLSLRKVIGKRTQDLFIASQEVEE